MSRKNILTIVLFLAALSVLGLRMIHPSADPPTNLSRSAGPYGDPGGYAFNARNKILFGTWEIDEVNPMYHTLIPHFATYAVFKLFGVGVLQMNIVPIFFGCLVLILFFLALRGRFPVQTALLAFFLLGGNYLFIMYGRIANRVMPMLFFLILTLFLLRKFPQPKLVSYAAGLICFMAVASKFVCLYVIPAFFLGILLTAFFNQKRKLAFFSAFFYLIGFLTGAGIWYFFVYRPYKYIFASAAGLNKNFLIPPKNISIMLRHFWERPSIFFNNMPVVSLLAGVGFILLLYRLILYPKKLGFLEWTFLFWFAGGFVFYAIIYQRVPRHFIPQIIPMTFLAAYFLHVFLKTEKLAKPARPGLLFWPALTLFFLFPSSWLIRPLLARLPASLRALWPSFILLAVFSAAVSLLFYAALKLWPRGFCIRLTPAAKKTVTLFLFLAFIFFNGRSYLSWALHPEFKIKTMGQDLGQAFEKAIVAGLWAPVVCMENHHRAYEWFPRALNDKKDFLESFGITHVLATDFFNEIGDYQRRFPNQMEKARLLVRYPIWVGLAYLYELHPAPDESPALNVFEAEIFTLRPGFPRFDPQASRKFSLQVKKGRKGLVLKAPMSEILPQGKYKAVFRMKNETNTTSPPRRIARISVFSLRTGLALRTKNIFSTDFSKAGEYHEFSLDFYLSRPQKVSFRIYADGTASFWTDSITLSFPEN